jgi:hypothetical protein
MQQAIADNNVVSIGRDEAADIHMVHCYPMRDAFGGREFLYLLRARGTDVHRIDLIAEESQPDSVRAFSSPEIQGAARSAICYQSQKCLCEQRGPMVHRVRRIPKVRLPPVSLTAAVCGVKE